jgi:hypothetical protein
MGRVVQLLVETINCKTRGRRISVGIFIYLFILNVVATDNGTNKSHFCSLFLFCLYHIPSMFYPRVLSPLTKNLCNFLAELFKKMQCLR